MFFLVLFVRTNIHLHKQSKHMKKIFTLIAAFSLYLGVTNAQNSPEILHYTFDGSGTTVPNQASNPPAGTGTATLVGGMTQGGTGLCGGALIGDGASGGTSYVNTGWNTNLGNNPWTIMFWTNDIPNTTTLYYQFGDPSASSFRCFNNGVAGAGNWMLRGPVTDVTCTGCAPVGNVPSMTAFVYDPVAGDIKAYHDGVLVNTVPQGALNITGTAFQLCYASGTGMGAGQLMDEFRFYDRAVPAAEVLLVYDQCLPISSSPNDAGVTALTSPVDFCAGTENIDVVIRNFGTQQIDSCVVNWTFDGVPQTPFMYYGLLDTFNGAFQNIDTVTLGVQNFLAGVSYNITAWTVLPNGVADTVNNNDTLIMNVQPALSGSFTIGATGDYLNFTDAVADLNAYGICSPVIFDVENGTYNEQIELGQINGTSSTNTITFQSLNGIASQVLLTHNISTSAADNYTVRFSGADYVTFKEITIENTSPTYSTAIDISGGSHFNTFEGNEIKGDPATLTTSTNKATITSFSGSSIDSMNTFNNNLIQFGSYGMYWYGNGTTDLEAGLVFTNNTVSDMYYYGARLYYLENSTFTGNTISFSPDYTGSTYGFYAAYADGKNDFSMNQIDLSNHYGYGMYLNNCTSLAADKGYMANNFVIVGDSLTTSTSYGIYLTSVNNHNVMNNSVNLFSNGASSRGLYATGGTGNDVLNNIFKTRGPGYGIYVLSGVNNSDYNVFYNDTLSGGVMGNVGYFGSALATLNDWQTTTGWDLNSAFGDPGFFSEIDLHTCNDSLLDGNGIVDSMLTMDVDGQLRDLAAFDIGADEFLGLATFGFANDTISKCSTDVAVLGGWNPQTDGSYLWSSGDTTNSISTTNAGIYTVNVTTACGSAAASVVVENVPDAVASFTSNTVFLTGVFTSTSVGADTWSWDFGDGNTSNVENPVNVYTSPGQYIVTLVVSGPCGTDSITAIFEASIVGINELDLSDRLEIHPNPNTGVFTINMTTESNEPVNAELMDAQGKLVWNKKYTSNGVMKETVDLSTLARGVYALRLTVNNQVAVKQVVIE